MIYLDTSYLARLYLEDHGYEQVRSLAARFIICSGLHGRAENVSALHRAWRERRIEEPAFLRMLGQFQTDCLHGGIVWLPFTAGVFDRIEQAFTRSKQDLYLRAADAMHLACAGEHGLREVYSNDRHLLAAAPLFGLRGLDLIPAHKSK